jgi:hypothetical protein
LSSAVPACGATTVGANAATTRPRGDVANERPAFDRRDHELRRAHRALVREHALQRRRRQRECDDRGDGGEHER